MQITVNGAEESIDSCTILDFIKSKKLGPEKVVIEYNLKIIKRDLWKETRLQEFDNLEVITLVGGG